jgi:hypothetical protein
MAGPPRRQGWRKESYARSASDAHARAGIGASVAGEGDGVNPRAVRPAAQGCLMLIDFSNNSRTPALPARGVPFCPLVTAKKHSIAVPSFP